MNSTAATTATRPRPTFTPPPAEDPRPWIPSGPKALAVVPSTEDPRSGANKPPKPSAEDLPRRVPGATKPPKPPSAAVPTLPTRPQPHERDGRQPAPEPARPHSRPSAVVPVAFIASTKEPARLDDMASWQAADFETMRILDETVPPFLSPVGVTALARAEARIAATAVVRTPGRVAEVVSLLHRRHLPPSRRWRAARRLEAVYAERAALGVAS